MATKRSKPQLDDQRAIGRRLKSVRAEQGMTIKEAAERFPMSASNWGHYESGRNRLSADDIPRFADALGIEREEMLRRLRLGEPPKEQASTHARTQLYELLLKNPDVLRAFERAAFSIHGPFSERGATALIYIIESEILGRKSDD